MSLWEAILLGALQGLTEFLPVSSSGHLVLMEHLLDLPMAKRDLMGFDILLHAGTAVALLLLYWRTWWNIALGPARGDREHSRLFGRLIVATVPAAALGVLAEEYIADRLRSPLSVGIAFLFTAAVLYTTRYRKEGRTLLGGGWLSAFLTGCAQAAALVPGVSRSGVTIAAAQWTGTSRTAALDFSFLMALPIILGALVLTLFDVWRGEITLPPPTIAWTGFGVSSVISAFAIILLRRIVRRYSLAIFSIYLIAAATISIGIGVI